MAYEKCPGYMKNGRCKGNNRLCRVAKEDIEKWFDETLKPIDLIHDLKTGAVPAHMEQLFIYDALFCMEYHVKPKDILIENRIYQNDDVLIETPTADIIDPIIEKIKEFDKIIADLR